MAKRILITGGAGFVGSHLAEALLARGDEVRLFDNLTEQVHRGILPSSLGKDTELIVGDIADLSAVQQACTGVDIVVHLAAAVGVGQSMYEISRYVATNILGTANLLQALLANGNQIEKLIVASSMSIYGEGKSLCANCGEIAPGTRGAQQIAAKNWELHCPQCNEALTPIPTDESKPLQCSSIYALSKRDQEEMCLLFGRTYNVPVVALRYFNMYGPGQSLSNPYTGVAAIFASRLLNRRRPLIYEDGKQMRDFVSVHDVVSATILAMERDTANGRAINVASGAPVSVREIALTLSDALGLDIAPEITGKHRAGDIRHCFADISAAIKLLGYEPKISFTTGMEKLVEWLHSQESHDLVELATRELVQFGLTS